MTAFKFYASLTALFFLSLITSLIFSFSGVFTVITVITHIVLGFLLMVDMFDEKGNELFELHKEGGLSLWKIWGTIILIYLFLGSFILGKTVYSNGKDIYNTSINYQNEYTQLCQEKQGFYDNLWKSYYQKTQITNMNKETFLQVTKLIMDGRSDGKNMSWKWVQENQQIPYSEFTQFYSDLSVFIETRRDGYLAIEKKCQELAKKNNVMLDTFPNNLFNKYLNLPHIKFEYGFLSDKTEKVFVTKKENLDE